MSDVKVKVRCGLFLRPMVRAIFDYTGMSWVEHKEWLGSHFIATGSPVQAMEAMGHLEKMRVRS